MAVFRFDALFTPLFASAMAQLDGHQTATGAVFSSSVILLLVYCGLIAISSMCGGVLPMLFRLTHTRMQMLVSLIGGLMLGVGIFHQLPHAVAAMPGNAAGESYALDWCMGWLMFGLLLTFFMLRMFHFHSHEPVDAQDLQPHDHDCAHDHDHDRGAHHHDHDHGGSNHPSSKGSWIGIFLGLSLHTLLDGVALASSVQADALHYADSHTFTLLGLGTFLGVVLHKPLDSLSITSLMAAGGWSIKSMRWVNIGYALMCPLGALLFSIGIQGFGAERDVIIAAALAMSAGVFICISLSDLLPEVQFHSHDRLWLSASLLFGIGAAWGIGYLEPEHSHPHGRQDAPAAHKHADPVHEH